MNIISLPMMIGDQQEIRVRGKSLIMEGFCWERGVLNNDREGSLENYQGVAHGTPWQ